MGRKQFIKVEKKLHKDCIHCSAVTDRHLSNEGKPILGECLYSRYNFLLDADANCENYTE